MAEERRSKRLRATPTELAELSSSRGPNSDSEILGDGGDAPVIRPRDTSSSSPNEASAEVDRLSQRNSHDLHCLETAQMSGHSNNLVITGLSSGRNPVNAVQEQPCVTLACLGTMEDPSLHRIPRMAAINDLGEASAEPQMVTNTSHRDPNTATMNEHDVSPAHMDNALEMPIERNISPSAISQQREVPAELELVGEVAVETVPSSEMGAAMVTSAVRLVGEVAGQTMPSSQIGAPTVASTEASHHGTDDRVGGTDINSLKVVSDVGEENDQADRADGTNCPICMEPWTGEGIHRICCLSCGHLFGRSCIRRWLQQRGKKNGKCPHCNRKARIEDIRNLYVPSLTVADDKSQQLLEDLGVLRSKNEELVVQNNKLKREYEQLQALLAGSCGSCSPDIPGVSGRVDRGKSHTCSAVEECRPSRPYNYSIEQGRSKENFFMKRSSIALQAGNQMRSQNSLQACGIDMYSRQQAPKHGGNESQVQFQLQEEFSLPGARVFDMDAFSQMLLVAQKSSALGGSFYLNKLSLLSLSDAVAMPLPQSTGAVRDIRVAPPGGKLPGRLALIASLGKMLSLFSLESNNVVLTYKLQSPCWSCAWDPSEPNVVFAGLQDGGLSVFDIRQTSSPLRSLPSFCRQPVHTLHPVNECNLPRRLRRHGILSACSSGVCFWDSAMLGLHDSRPHAIPCADNQGICVALAYSQLANVAVATFRGKPSLHQAQAPMPASETNSTEPCGLSSQAISQPTLSSHPLPAAHYPLTENTSTSLSGNEPSCTSDSAPTSSSTASASQCGGDVPFRQWTYGNPMFGNVSPVGMHRSSIVCSLSSESCLDFPQSVFAFGDEETRALMLWDVKTLTMVDRLKAHSSPILDVRSMNIGGHSILGCTSGTTLQVYKR